MDSTRIKLLKAKLYEQELQKRNAEKQKLEDSKADIEWGSQIRSYVFQPYQLVKDLRTGVEVGQVDAVMDGDLDRFIEAMLAIRAEIARVAQGQWPVDDNPLHNAPHTAEYLLGEWSHPYTREEGAYPVARLRATKYWPPVRRIDGAHGDRNLICACPPITDFAS